MVFIVLHKQYTAFANVRIAWIPQELGRSGELRITRSGKILHRIYSPRNNNEKNTYLYVPTKDIDIYDTQVIGCEAKIVTISGYQYWFRFPSDADAVVFARLLHEVEELGCGLSRSEWREYRRRMSFRRFDLVNINGFDTASDKSDDDCWIEPWTNRDVVSDELWADCRCHEIGHKRYAYEYTNEYCEFLTS
jgi:hypothetical protein